MRLERLNNFDGLFAIGLADALLVRSILVVVHAVAGRGDGRLEPQAIVRHAREKTRRALAAPPILTHGDLQLGHADRQISLHDPRIHLLLRDGVAADGQPVAFLQEQTTWPGRFPWVELREIRVVRFGLELLGGKNGNRALSEQKRKQDLFHRFDGGSL